ncbi:MAG: hypothetical protein K8T20_10585 [Planctomycetes bacterium]|nr:hypothetical protein [Planctomycetota bacterium]
MALVMVVVIAALLAAIAIPFALSMRAHESGARGANDRVHARFAAVAARNRAVAAAIPGHETLEEKLTSPLPFNTPWFDTSREFWPGHAGRAPGAGLESGASVQDEQGKLNVRTAPEMAVKNLLKRVDGRVEDRRGHLTEASGRPAAWIFPQTIRWMAPFAERPDLVKFWIDSGRPYSVGSRIRVTGTGAPLVGEIIEYDRSDGGYVASGVTAATQVDSLLELEARHPVNVNTASRQVLAACMEGLALYWELDKDKVTRAEADRVAERMVGETFRDEMDLLKFLGDQVEQKVISDADWSAIVVNMSCPTSEDLGGTGTVPFTCQSWNIVAITAHGICERPTKAVGAECEIREVVEVAPAGPIRWRHRSQVDFERSLALGFGRGVVTGPALRSKGEQPNPDRGKDAWLTPVTGKDLRGGWDMTAHFDGNNNGQLLDGGLTYDGLASFREGDDPCWPAGAAELWFRAPATSATIFEAGSEEWSNRIVLTYEVNGGTEGPFLRLSVKDATLEHGRSQVIHHVRLVEKTWYHVGGFWRGTRNGEVGMMLDGLPVGEWQAVPGAAGNQDAPDQGVAVHLAIGLAKGVTQFAVDAAPDSWPLAGAIAIGSECIEYSGRTGARFTGCTRGARGTKALEHPFGVTVAPWGYHSLVGEARVTYVNAGQTFPPLYWDRIPETNGNLQHGFGTEIQTITGVRSLAPTDPPSVGLDAGEAILEVAPGGAVEFPAEGWLWLGGQDPELVSYDSHTDSRFSGLKRGLFGTADIPHMWGEAVVLFGFKVSSNAGYPSPTILMIDGEFIGPLQKEGTDGWVSLIGSQDTGTTAIPLLRGKFWTGAGGDIPHAANARVMPTFALADWKAGKGDRVTLVQKDLDKREEAWIGNAVWLEGGKPSPEPPGLFFPDTLVVPEFLLAGLDRQVIHEVKADGKYSRILQFPSGELPYAAPAAFKVGVSEIPTAPKELTEWVDEVRVMHSRPDNFGLWEPIDSVTTLIQFGVWTPEDPYAMPPPPGKLVPAVPAPPIPFTQLDTLGGAILIDDEIIGYAEYDAPSRSLKGVQRGYLGTTARAHAKGSVSFPLIHLAIGALAAAIDKGGNDLPLNSLGGFPAESFVLVDTEIIGASRQKTDNLTSPRGCSFRGAFGTEATNHSKDALVYAMPFRYFDRYTRAADDSDLHWFGATFRATGARWKSLKWDEILGNGSTNIRLFVRFDAGPRWIEMPLESKGRKKEPIPRFIEFEDPKGGSLEGTVADQVDVRVMFEYLDGAYKRGQWKAAPEFRGLEAIYEQDNVIHQHEER